MTENMPEHVTQEFLDIIKLPSPDGKRLNYLIVMPRMAERDDISYPFPYGLCIVSSALKASGRNVFTLNLNYKQNHLEHLRNFIIDNSIDVVLSGGLSGQYAILKEIFDTAKSVDTDIVTICGGGIITADPLVAMQAFETADYGVIGEGEITVNELAYAIETNADSARICGVATKSGVLPTRGEIANLDCLPFPNYDGFEFELLVRDGLYSSDRFATIAANVAISRSCPYNCTFCFHSSGKKYRRRSLDNVFEELDWLIAKYKLTHFTFADELFIGNAEFITGFCERIKPYNLTWGAQTRVDTVSVEILSRLKDAGCSMILFGVESADNSILKSMRKNITVEQIDAAFDAAKQVGLWARGNIIFGDLEETRETIVHSLNWWKAHQNWTIYLLWIYTFPGSHLYKTAIKRGIISDPVKYLKDNRMQINVSKIPDKEYWDMVVNVELFQWLYGAGIDVDIEALDFSVVAKKLTDLCVSGKVAVWPIILTVAEMLNRISPEFVAHPNTFLVNVNPHEVHSKGVFEITGKPTLLPQVIEDNQIETVLYAFPQFKSTVLSEITMMIDDLYPSVKRIVTIKDLLD
ncbi:MAG: B12-binding domain-containing radical SAM protein [Synergistaceae bacterium]|nr:B12-binding domain-containing radical SAM protein [Synergistaceae bacterium]